MGARVSTKGSNVEIGVISSREEDVADVIPTMGLFVQCGSTIHSVTYADDAISVSVEKVIDGDAEVPYRTSKIQYLG